MSIKNELLQIVGKENFIDDPEFLKQYSRDYSLEPPRMPTYVVKPREVREIQEIVKLANRTRIPLVPCSSKVHFYGSTIPKEGGIIVDLSGMNRILNIDVRNRHVRIEPGVTWGQLQEALKKYDLMALNPLLPHAGKSALTSCLEREPMLIPKFEYSEPILTMEVVLPTGEILRTGAASTPDALSPDALTDLCNPYGPGLDFFRLFHGAQGTLGIVTWANMKIEFRPKVQENYFLSAENLWKLIEVTYKVQRRMIGSECFIINSVNLATILAENWPADFENLKENLPAFIMVLVLAGGLRRPEEKIAYERDILLTVASELSLETPQFIPNIPPSLSKKLIEMLRSSWPENLTYWKHRLRGGSLDIFFLTTMNRIPEITKAMIQIASKYGYPPDEIGIYVQPLERGRISHCEYNLFYNPENQAGVKQMQKLYAETVEVLTELGAFFSRPYGKAAEVVYSKCTTYTLTLKKVKSILDPNNVMNPEKLCF